MSENHLYVTKTTELNGRLCNQIIRNIATSLIAEKNDLYVDYSSYDKITKLGIPLFIGNTNYKQAKLVNELNFFDVFENSPINQGIFTNTAYFQTKEISNLIYNYLNKDEIKAHIMNKNPYNDRYDKNKDCFIHIRLDDATIYNPGIDYYLVTIYSLLDKIDNIIISTDSPNHDIIIKLIEIFSSKAKILITEEVDTIQFGSTCKYIILSHGSFSAIIGWLGFYSQIYYPEYDKIWFGDMFTIDGWKKVEYISK